MSYLSFGEDFAIRFALFASSLGIRAVLPTLPLYIRAHYNITDSKELASAVSYAFGASPLAAAAFNPVWGAIGDHYNKRTVLMYVVVIN